MHRFFVDEDSISNDRILLKESDVNHIRNVLRMKAGDEIIVCDDGGFEYTCVIDKVSPDSVTAVITDVCGQERELDVNVFLYQGLPKGGKMETIIQKTVELGVTGIVPMRTERTVVRLDEEKEKSRLTRWRAVAKSAAQQSKRGIIPKIAPVMNFQEAVEDAKKMDLVLMPYENARNMPETKRLVAGVASGMNVAIFIGPEGGFSKEEVEFAKKHGAHPVTLGRRILRTETAGMALMSVLMFAAEE